MPAGGAHHGLANQAQGFGIYNETAVAVRALLDAGLERVAYVNLDVHHGNGTQWIFYDEPRVLTRLRARERPPPVPGLGLPGRDRRGGRPGLGAPTSPCRRSPATTPTAPPGTRVVAPVVRAFGPDAIVAQCGVDHHHADPLSHMLTTMPLYRDLWARLRELADEACERAPRRPRGRRLRALHRPAARVGRARGRAGGRCRCDGPVPESWRRIAARGRLPRAARAAGGRTPGPAPDPDRDRRAAAEAEAAIEQSVVALSRFWDLSPSGRPRSP